MNAPTNRTPCERYEHEIADLVDGLLEPEAERDLRAHLANCAACRAWAEDYAATSAGLAAGLPRPSVSPGFDAALRERIDALRAVNGREARRAAADAEHEALLRGLRRYTGRSALLGSLGTALGVGIGLSAAERVIAEGGRLQGLLTGHDLLYACGGLGTAIAIATIAWFLSRSAIALPRLPGL